MNEAASYRASRDVDGENDAVLQQIRGVLQGLRFGSVTIVVQDGVVVQIDRTEKRKTQPKARRAVALAHVADAPRDA